jgi:hypothetical protein
MENVERGGHWTCDLQAYTYTGTSMGMQGKLIRAWSVERSLRVIFGSGSGYGISGLLAREIVPINQTL